MSTKNTVSYSALYHLYSDCFNDKELHLRCETETFSVEGCKGCISMVTVSLPLNTWREMFSENNVRKVRERIKEMEEYDG